MVPDEQGRVAGARREWLLAALVMVVAVALRLPALGRDGMWSDECLTATWAALPWRATAAAAWLIATMRSCKPYSRSVIRFERNVSVSTTSAPASRNDA